MEDLIAWLRACLDDDEKAAKAATKGPWRADGTMVFIGDTDETVAAYSDYYMDDAYDGPEMSGLEKADASHIARHDPAAVLEDIRMKRDLLDEYEAVAHLDTDQPPTEYAHGRAVGLGEAVKTIAAAYRHRPGFKESWGV